MPSESTRENLHDKAALSGADGDTSVRGAMTDSPSFEQNAVMFCVNLKLRMVLVVGILADKDGEPSRVTPLVALANIDLLN
jgi:hypothetical protein